MNTSASFWDRFPPPPHLNWLYNLFNLLQVLSDGITGAWKHEGVSRRTCYRSSTGQCTVYMYIVLFCQYPYTPGKVFFLRDPPPPPATFGNSNLTSYFPTPTPSPGGLLSVVLLVTSCWVSRDGLASHPGGGGGGGGEVILLFTSCWVTCDGLESHSRED